MSMIKRTHTFTIDHQSDLEKKTFSGKFTMRIVSFSDKTKIGVRTAQILGGMYCVRDDEGMPTGRGVDESTEHNARVIAWLETVLVQKPEWFKLDDVDEGLLDEKLIYKIFGEVMKYEGTFRGDGGKAAEADDGSASSSEGAGGTQPAAANAGDSPKKVVGREVQAALDA